MTLTWSAPANADRDEILEYLATDSVSVALRNDELIEEACDLLKEFPRAGRPGRLPDTRELAIPRTPLLLIYRLTLNEVVIVRVLHGARKWPA